VAEWIKGIVEPARMTELLVRAPGRREGEDAIGAPNPWESLTARARSGRLPRHEEDLSAEEAQEKQDPRFPQAVLDTRWPQRPEAPPREGPQAARAERAEEVGAGVAVRLGKGSRLRLRREFLAVQERGRKLHAGEYLVLASPNALGRPRLGVTVSSRIANAVGRNRLKRWIREAFRAAAGGLPALDLVLIARAGALSGGLEAARRAVASAQGRSSERGT
jgi:ribonuclease P protein component